jgi:lysine 2,3-aminomutase
MDDWQRTLREDLVDAEEIAQRFGVTLRDIQFISSIFPFKVTRYYMSLIKEKNDALYKQVIPDSRELAEDHVLYEDPLSEDSNSPVHNVVHRYPDRCLFLVSPECAGYCRFCTRKRKVGDGTKISMKYIDEGIRYIQDHSEIRDVILSGGDPLILDDARLEYVLQKLRRISHVEILRIGSRVPCFFPQRITPALTSMLRKYHPLFMNVHFNHPDELTYEAVRALAQLADAGIPLGNQTVLLRGVNDDADIMKMLMQRLLKARVRPYYIYQADMVFGTEHFRTTVRKGLEIIQSLRGWTSGLAVPYFVIDSPGGGGKIPILPQYVLKMNDEEVVLRNYEGKIYRYRQVERRRKQVRRQAAPFMPVEADAVF